MGIIIKKPLGASLKYSPFNKDQNAPDNLAHSSIPGSNIKYYSSPSGSYGNSIFKQSNSDSVENDIYKPLGASEAYELRWNTQEPNFTPSDQITKLPVASSNISISSTLGNQKPANWQYQTTGKKDEKISYATYDQDQIVEAGNNQRIGPNIAEQNKIVDFRSKLRSNNKYWNSVSSPDKTNLFPETQIDYNGVKNLENRVNLGNPGLPAGKDLKSYKTGVKDGAASLNSYDKITHKELTPISGGEDVNDLVKFRIAAINNDSPNEQIYMYFRAFLNGINDSYTGNWDSVNYVGRGENFYNYTGFDRKVSLSFTVAAQSKIELIPMYKKLNYLASQLAPDYSKNGYMRGPLLTLTIGGYFYEQPGFLTGLTYELSEESPWEIGIPDGDENPFYDKTVKELPHMIKVSNFSFTPIHNFVPKKADWKTLGGTPFIALSNGTNTNY